MLISKNVYTNRKIQKDNLPTMVMSDILQSFLGFLLASNHNSGSATILACSRRDWEGYAWRHRWVEGVWLPSSGSFDVRIWII